MINRNKPGLIAEPMRSKSVDGFYMIMASVLKGLMQTFCCNRCLKYLSKIAADTGESRTKYTLLNVL